MSNGRHVRLTAAGRKAFWESQVRKTSLPTAYQRLLGLVEFQGHSNVIRSYLRHYPDELIDEWLLEVEELGLVEPVPIDGTRELSFSDGERTMPPLTAEDRKRLTLATTVAGASLGRTGVYVAEDRVQNRPAREKRPAQTEVLIVEDDPDQLALAELRVTMAGFQVRRAETAAALLRTLKDESVPDLLLLDVMLPDGNGFDILADLRRHPAHTLLPIVMLTVRDAPADIERGLALGADGYLTKPYSKAVLADTIRRVLRQ